MSESLDKKSQALNLVVNNINMVEKIFKLFFKIWAFSGKAPGILYRVLETYSYLFSNKKLKRKVVGNNVIYCNLQDHIQNQIYFWGAYEPIDSYLLKSLITPDMFIFDIGANIGFYSLFLSNGLTTGRVYSFEAVPETYKELVKNIKESSKENLVLAYNCAIWDKKEEVSLSLNEKSKNNNIGAYSIFNHDQITSTQVLATSIDAFVSENNISRVDVIKLDIEGAEYKALLGGINTIKKFMPIFLIEIIDYDKSITGHTKEDIWHFFHSLGYYAYEVCDDPSEIQLLESFKDIVQSNVLLSPHKIDHKLKKGWTYKGIKNYFKNESK